MVGAPLADWLMRFYATPVSVGVWETFLTMAAIYFVFMLAGAFAYRVPASGWAPAGWAPAATQISNVMITSRHVHLEKAWKTPQFWLIWSVLCLNVSAGIGILGMASPLLQEVFGGKLIGVDVAFNDLTAAQKRRSQPLRQALPVCCPYSISAGGFSGLRVPITWGARQLISFSLFLGSFCMRPSPVLVRLAVWRCSCWRSA
jgi:hypothetical protein